TQTEVYSMPTNIALRFVVLTVVLLASLHTRAQGPDGRGVVHSVSPGDSSIVVGGTAADPMVAVAPNGITNDKIADDAISPAKITGTAATLGPNSFVGNQAVSGDLNISGNLTMVDSTATAGNILKDGVLFIHNPGGTSTFVGKGAGISSSSSANTGIGYG